VSPERIRVELEKILVSRRLPAALGLLRRTGLLGLIVPELRGKLDKLGFTAGLIVVEAFDMNLWLAARNLPKVDVLEAGLIDPVSLVGAEKVVISAAALKIVEERLR
jgi:tRNA nucleotidyltransferase/poly(A) polymerase